MSRFSRTNGPPAAAAIAALHEGAGSTALVVLRVQARRTVTMARTFAPGHEAEIVAALSSAGVSRLVRIAPARRTVCRIATLQPSAPEELSAAAALLAEGSLPEDIPAHRRAAGILPGSGPAGAFALLTAWRNGTDEVADIPWPDQTWTTEIAALAFLSAGRGTAFAASPESGAVLVIAPGVGRIVARVLVEHADTRSGWDRAVSRHVQETCASAGAEPPVMTAGRRLVISGAATDAVCATVDGVPSDASWIETYGLALGAALVATSADPGAAGLGQLTLDPPWRRAPWPERAAVWLSAPRHAAAVLALAVVVALLCPLGFAAARTAILTRKTEGLPDQDKARAQVQQRAAVYREMERSRWPMTKLLADISGATPEGVTVDSVTLAPDQGLALKGNAESQDLLNQLQRNLNDTGLFEKLKVARAEATSSGVSFDVSAEVVNPHAPVKPADDFAATPLAVRLYGESARGHSGTSATDGESGPASRREERSGRSGRDERSDRRGRSADAPSSRPTSSKLDIPPPITDAQIGALDRAAAMKEWAYRKKVAGSGQSDAATKERLEQEIPKLAERMKSAGGGS